MAAGAQIALSSEIAHHALRVLRLREGDAITLFTGERGEYEAVLTRIGRRDAHARLTGFVDADRESPIDVTLVQAIASSETMDGIVRHAVELGVRAVQPVVTARSARFPEGAQGEKRLAHWRHVAIAACEQCGRNRIPAVHGALALAQWLAARDTSRGGIVLDPQGGDDWRKLDAPAHGVDLLVGPEGGLTEEELTRVSGLRRVRMGPRVLRTGTASLAALAAIGIVWGDLR